MVEMYGVEFEDDDSDWEKKIKMILAREARATLVAWMKRMRIVRTNNQALTVLLLFVIIMVTATIYIARPGIENTTIVTEDGREIELEAYLRAKDNGIDLTKE